VFVGGGVVDHQVQIEVRRQALVDQVEEAAELLGAVPRRHLRDHLTGSDVEGRVSDTQSWLRRSGTPGISGSTGAERSSAWICAFSSTHSTDRSLRRVEMEPDDVAELVDELRIG